MAEQTIKVGNQFTEIQIPQGDFTLFLDQNSKYFFVSRSSNGDNSIFSNETLLLKGPATIYVKGDNPESYIILSDFFKVLPIGGSGGGGSYVFDEPLNETGNTVSLNLANDLQVRNGNLTLKLTVNNDFIQLAQLVQSLSSGVEWVGKTTDTNDQVTVNHQLLSDFVQNILGRPPRVGDLVLTNDTPPYGWIYVNVYDPQTGQITNQDWETIGTTAVNIATQNTVGLVKGSNTITVGSDGSISIDTNQVVDIASNQTMTGTKTFSNDVIFGGRLEFSGNNTSFAPSEDRSGDLYLSNGQVGPNCYANMNLENRSKIKNSPLPTDPGDVANKGYVDSKLPIVLPAGTQPTTSNIGNLQVAFVLK